MDSLIKQLVERLVESTVALEVAAKIIEVQGFPKTAKIITEHAEINTKLLNEIKESIKE